MFCHRETYMVSVMYVDTLGQHLSVHPELGHSVLVLQSPTPMGLLWSHDNQAKYDLHVQKATALLILPGPIMPSFLF